MAAERTANIASIHEGKHVIYLLSPQPWDGFHVSKHNYAKELAAASNRVFFVEPPVQTGRYGQIDVVPTGVSNIARVQYRPFFPYKLKFRSRWLFNKLMRLQARRLIEKIGDVPDIVWDFDNSFQFSDLTAFDASLSIFHPVDSFKLGLGSKSADIVLSCTPEYAAMSGVSSDRLLIVPHGLRQEYASHAARLIGSLGDLTTPLIKEAPRRQRVGYVGNLLHPGIDWETMLLMMQAYPGVDFIFFGPFAQKSGGSSPIPLGRLKEQPNCTLRGLATPDQILQEASDIDVWLMCYDIRKTLEGSISSHKVLEYLASGRAVLTNHMPSYRDAALAIMPPGDDNSPMVEMLGQILADSDLNAPDQQRRRAAFALSHTYASHLRRIDDFLLSRREPADDSAARLALGSR